jgi:hypothetical protein
MKVKDLIEELKKVDPEKRIRIVARNAPPYIVDFEFTLVEEEE